MNQTQTTTTLAPIIAFIAGFLASRFTFLDAATWTAIITGVVGIIATVWAAVATRKTALIDQTGKFSNTVVVTTPEIANSLPNNTSVLPSDEVKVSEIKK